MYVLFCQANPDFAPPWTNDQDIKKRFGEQYGPSIQTAPAFSMNAEFAPVLQRQMNAFNSDPPGDSLQVLTAAAYCICRQYERLLSEETNAYSAALKPFQYRMHPSVTIGIPFVVLDISPVPHIPVLYSTGHIVFCAIRQPTAVGVGLKHLSTTVVEDQFGQRMSHPGEYFSSLPSWRPRVCKLVQETNGVDL